MNNEQVVKVGQARKNKRVKITTNKSLQVGKLYKFRSTDNVVLLLFDSPTMIKYIYIKHPGSRKIENDSVITISKTPDMFYE